MELLLRSVRQQLATHRGSARAMADVGALCSAWRVERLVAGQTETGLDGEQTDGLVTRRTSTRALYTTIDGHDATAGGLLDKSCTVGAVGLGAVVTGRTGVIRAPRP